MTGPRYKYNRGKGAIVRDDRFKSLPAKNGKDCVAYVRGELEQEDCDERYNAFCMEKDKTCKANDGL